MMAENGITDPRTSFLRYKIKKTIIEIIIIIITYRFNFLSGKSVHFNIDILTEQSIFKNFVKLKFF